MDLSYHMLIEKSSFRKIYVREIMFFHSDDDQRFSFAALLTKHVGSAGFQEFQANISC